MQTVVMRKQKWLQYHIKIDFKVKKINKDKEVYYIITKVSTYQEHKGILNGYLSNSRPSKYMKKKLIQPKGKMTNLQYLGTSVSQLSETERTTRQEISKDTEELNNTINHQDLTDMYRLLYPTTAWYTFFSSAMKHALKQTISQVTK